VLPKCFMNQRFYQLLDNTLAEIWRRESSYTSSFPMSFSHVAEMASEYRRHPLLNAFSSNAVEQAFTEGLAHFGQSWPRSHVTVNGDELLHRFLCDSIVDAFCADQGLLSLRPHNRHDESLSHILAEQYIERQASGGARYYVRKRGNHPLLLINATGMPIEIWQRFLADSMHDFKIIVPRRRGTDPFVGGLHENVDIRTESADFASILGSEGADKAAVVAWCNGARIGIDLAHWRADQISSLVLVGPMLKGIQGIPPKLSVFDTNLQPLLDAVMKEPSWAPLFSDTLSSQAKAPDWSRWRNAPASRVQALFALPANDLPFNIMAPLSDSESFLNIARRVKSDETYPLDHLLAELRVRTMVIMGSHDQIVSNDLVCSVMKKLCANPVVKVVVSASGHYIHDLQYHYFRFLLIEFLGSHRSPPETARVTVEELRSSDGVNRPQGNERRMTDSLA
jgi:pimeloyl-ACP methyl ester carboxylesterase